jgi:hypothetical protein
MFTEVNFISKSLHMTLCPSFERDPTHQFSLREAVYVIDDNRYDIWEAQIKKLTPKRIFVSFDHNGDDDQWVTKPHVLVKNEGNTAIFRDQERIRNAKQASEKDIEIDDEANKERALEEEEQRKVFEKWMPWLQGLFRKDLACAVQQAVDGP